jgi:hypothetical protein
MDADLEDFFAEHEPGYGEIESQEMREEMPEGYIWSCCSKRGDEDGCQVSKHTPNVRKRSKMRA